jgi:hypothetical protein
MSQVKIHDLPLSIVLSGANDYVPVDRSNGDGTYTTYKIVPGLIAGLSPATTLTGIEFIASANVGYPLNTGNQGYLVAPFSGTINSYALLADTAGTLTLDIRKCVPGLFDAGVTHPVAADTICGGSPPALVAASIISGAPAAGWTVAFNTGDVLAFNITSTDRLISQITLALSVTKTSIP